MEPSKFSIPTFQDILAKYWFYLNFLYQGILYVMDGAPVLRYYISFLKH